MGFWFRGHVEICLLGIHSKVKPFRASKSNIFEAKVRKHSQKPEEIFELIEPFCECPRLELFATEKRNGWDCIGFGANGQDVREFLENGVLLQ